VSPDGRRLAVTTYMEGESHEGVRLLVYQVDTGRRLWSAAADAPSFFGGAAVAWSPDGTRVATGGAASGQLILRDADTGSLVAEPAQASAESVGSVAFTGDGRMIVTAGTDGTVRLWDGTSLKQVGSPLSTAGGGAFVPEEGDSVIVCCEVGPNGTRGAWVWDLDPARWARQACLVANRTLTRSEWKAFLPGRPYDPACSS